MSNHFHLLLSGEDSRQISDFMRHLNTNLSKEAGRLHDWSGPLFEGRHQRIPVSNESRAQIARLRYILSQGTKEGLVARPADWPGANCVRALLGEEDLKGTWRDRTKEYAARQLKRGATQEVRCETECILRLAPLPCWRQLADSVRRKHVRDLIDEIEQEAAERHRRNGTRPRGPRNVRNQHPHRRPTKIERSPAPYFHGACRSILRQFFEAYQTFAEAFREAANRMHRAQDPHGFPEGSFPPRLSFVPP